MMKKVLLVDDKAENLYLLQSMLDLNGFKTIPAKNGAEALGLMRTNIPDLIIADILMPVMDGFTLCQECKKDESLKNIPFFFYTATYIDARDEEYAMSLGADKFILKPQEPDVFIKIIIDFLEDINRNAVHPKEIHHKAETVVLKEYNEVLIRKIEDKMLQSEKAEKNLKNYSEKLEKEILERKKNEAALKVSQQVFKTLAEVSPVGIFRTKPNGETIYVNPTWTELSGLSFEEAQGNNWLKAVHPEDRAKVIENWESDTHFSKRSNAEYRFLRNDGSVVWVIGNAVPELINNEINGYIGTITDITRIKQFEIDLIQARDKAEESDRLKTAFLNNISHEVRTPMNAIIGFSNLLSDQDLEPVVRNDFLQTIVQSCQQLLSIITQIVNIAIVEAGQEKVYEKEVSLNSIFKMLFDQFSPEAAKKNIVLTYHTALSENRDIIETDETKLIQIISNLLSNALKFINHGSVQFGYLMNENHLEFYVKDTGIGIPYEMHEKIFERFRQVENNLTRNYDGSGLGLSISKAYVELLGGKIWVSSELDEGSIFKFTIPYNPPKQHENPYLSSNEESKQELKKTLTILVTEDVENNFLLLEQYLSGANIELVRASTGYEAVEICKNNLSVSLVLMDLKMPGMDGFEATKKIKAIRPQLPVIAQTAYARESDKINAFECGCSDFITKPYRREELLSMIRRQLKLEYNIFG
jgi:PAS domain S-box-containing protein